MRVVVPALSEVTEIEIIFVFHDPDQLRNVYVHFSVQIFDLELLTFHFIMTVGVSLVSSLH